MSVTGEMEAFDRRRKVLLKRQSVRLCLAHRRSRNAHALLYRFEVADFVHAWRLHKQQMTLGHSVPGITARWVSRVRLDAFRVDKNDLPAFSQRAWPGLAAAAVRRGLGEPAEVLHHTFFGINVDQWVYSRTGSDVSVFFRDDRVVAKAVGRQIPPDLFRVDLPSLPEREDLPAAPHVGMTAGEVERLNGAEKFRVDYIVNGEPVSRLVLETRAKGTFASFTLVDGVVTEFEDLGRLPDDAAFQGR